MSSGAAGSEKKAVRIPAREWTLLALCSVGTIVGLGVVWATVTRMEVPKEELTDLPCMILIDPVLPVRGRPNTVCSPLIREMGRIEYRFNDCGHRTNLPCKPAPAGTFRILALGSSIVEGDGVPVQDGFVERLPAQLERATGRRYDAYNTAMIGSAARGVALRIDEVFPLKPDMVLWPLTVFDVDHANLRTFGVQGQQPPDERRPSEQSVNAAQGSAADDADESRWEQAYNRVQESRYVFFLKHFLYQSPSMYESHFDSSGEGRTGSEFAGFLRPDPPPSWREHLTDFEFYFRQVASKLNERGIPLVVVLLPHRMQMEMISTGRWPAGEDPYALSRWLEPIVRRYGAAWIDILHDFRGIPDTGRFFFPVNGHMNVEGHKMLGAVVSQELARNILVTHEVSAACKACGAGAQPVNP